MFSKIVNSYILRSVLIACICVSTVCENASDAHPYRVFNFFKSRAVALGFFRLTNTTNALTTSDLTSGLQADVSTLGTKIVFCGTNSSGKSKLFAADRVSLTVTQLLDINASANDCTINTQISIKYSGKIYVILTNGTTPTPYVYDGINAPTVAWAVSTAAPIDTALFAKAAVYGGLLYFTANNSSAFKKYFSFNGTSVVQVTNINSAASDVTISNNMFVAYNQLFLIGLFPGSATVLKLYRYCDGVSGCGSAGLTISNIYGDGTTPSNSSDVSTLNVVSSLSGITYLLMKDFTTRVNKLHSIQSDFVIRRIAVDFSGSTTVADTITKMVPIGTAIYSIAVNSSGGSKLWQVDPVTPSITSISNLAAAASNDSIGGISLFSSNIYFSAKPTGALPGVWRVSGVTPVAIVTGGTLAVDPFIFGNELYFADGSANVVKLTAAGALTTVSTAIKFKSAVFVDSIIATDGNSMYFQCIGTAFSGTKICAYSP